MKNIEQLSSVIKALVFAGLCLLFSMPVSAQTPPAEIVYVESNLMKVEPGMEADYLKAEQVWKKVHQRRMADGKILNWLLIHRLYPSGTNADYDYQTATFFKSGKELEEAKNMTWDYLTKGMSKEDLAIAENTTKTRKMVARALFMELERGKPGGRFVQYVHMKVANGKEEEVEKFAKMMNPVLAEANKMGNITSWVFGRHLYPQTADGENYYRIFITNSLDDILKNETNGYFMEAFKKVYPNKDFMATMNGVGMISKDLGTEIWEIIDHAN